jgi:hypothetical protein
MKEMNQLFKDKYNWILLSLSLYFDVK